MLLTTKFLHRFHNTRSEIPAPEIIIIFHGDILKFIKQGQLVEVKFNRNIMRTHFTDLSCDDEYNKLGLEFENLTPVTLLSCPKNKRIK